MLIAVLPSKDFGTWDKGLSLKGLWEYSHIGILLFIFKGICYIISTMGEEK